MNYTTPGRLQAVYGSKLFPTPESENDYLRNPEKLANYVYANKYGNGAADSGDGWSYHGSGLIQLTFKENYLKVVNILRLDLVANPDLVRTDPDVAVKQHCNFGKITG